MSGKIIVIIGFDMETDIGSWTPFYKGLERGTPKILDLLSSEKISSTFFFTGEAAKKYPGIVRQVMDNSHEVGCHSLYHETVGDELFPIPGIKPLLPQELPFRIKIATEYVTGAAGEKIVSFRAPRLWGSTSLVNVLEELGYKTDVSYPLFYYRERLEPYHPDYNDWTGKGNMKILEIPVFADITMKSSDKYGRDMDQWPLFRTRGAKYLMEHIKSYVRYVDEKGIDPVVLCFYFHPWEFTKMPEGLIHYGEGSVLPDKPLTKNCGNYALEQFGELISDLKDMGAKFKTAKDFTTDYRKQDTGGSK